MSVRTLLIWVIIAGLLGGAVVIVRRQKLSGARENRPIAVTVGIDPAAVVTLVREGETRETLERDPRAIDRWVIRWGRGEEQHAWEAEAVKVRSGLRALATARVTRSDQDLVRSVAGSVTAQRGDGTLTRIEFGSDSAGGLTPVRVETRGPDGVATGRWFGRIERSVAEAFMGGSLLGWRRERLFDLAASAVRGVELESGSYATTLARSAGGWVLESPVAVHADTPSVEAMVRSLLSTRAAAFVDGAMDEEPSGMSEPLAVITLVGGEERVTLRVGTRADVDGDLVYARVERGDERTMVKLETTSLGKLTAVPDAYVGKAPSGRGLTEVRGVRVLGRGEAVKLDAVRAEGGWTINGAPADSLNREAVERLLGLLMRQPASGVRIVREDPGLSEIAWVELIGRDSAVLDRFGVALDQGREGMRVLFIQRLGGEDRVVWSQSGDAAAATGAWLTAVASRRVEDGI